MTICDGHGCIQIRSLASVLDKNRFTDCCIRQLVATNLAVRGILSPKFLIATQIQLLVRSYGPEIFEGPRCTFRVREFSGVSVVCEKKSLVLHLTTSKANSYGDCLVVKRKYYQNCFVLQMCYTCSVGMVNKHSSYSPVEH